MLSDVVTAAVIENDIFDHLPIIVKFKFKSNRKEQTRPLIQKISPQKVEHFVVDLDSELQNCIKSDTDNDIGILINCMSRIFFEEAINSFFEKTKTALLPCQAK